MIATFCKTSDAGSAVYTVKAVRTSGYTPFCLTSVQEWWYNVQVKRVTASEARRSWFRLLDEIVAGEVVVVERNGARVVLRREEALSEGTETIPDYGGLLIAPQADRADEWGWEWDEESGLVPRDHDR